MARFVFWWMNWLKFFRMTKTKKIQNENVYRCYQNSSHTHTTFIDNETKDSYLYDVNVWSFKGYFFLAKKIVM